MDCLLVLGKPMFPGNRSDRSKRSDRLKLDYGLEVFNRYNGEYDLRLQQYYADVSWLYFNLHAGARKGIGNH